MNKKILNFLLVALAAPAMSSCGSSKGAASRMEISINPDIEIMLNEKGMVASITALNNDGAVVISGEKLEGKSAEEASKIIVDISYKCGYLNETNNNIKVTVSGDDVKKLYSDVEGKINSYLEDNKIAGHVSEQVSEFATNLDAKIAEFSCKYNVDEIASMSFEEKLSLLEEYREETKNLVSTELQDSYAVKKANEYKEELLNAKEDAIEKLDAAVATAYESLINIVENAIDSINDLYEDNFLDENSAYQKALAKVYSYKTLIAKISHCKTINSIISTIDNSSSKNDTLFSAARTTLSAAATLFGEVDYTQSESAKKVVDGVLSTITKGLDAEIAILDQTKTTIKGLIDQATATLNTALTNIKNYELQMPSTIITNLEANAKDFVEKAEKEISNEYTEFAAEHKTKIETAKKQFADLKAALMGN